MSQRVRKRIEEAFGWAKTIAALSKTKLRGTRRVAAKFTFTMAAYNLIRMPRLEKRELHGSATRRSRSPVCFEKPRFGSGRAKRSGPSA